MESINVYADIPTLNTSKHGVEWCGLTDPRTQLATVKSKLIADGVPPHYNNKALYAISERQEHTNAVLPEPIIDADVLRYHFLLPKQHPSRSSFL